MVIILKRLLLLLSNLFYVFRRCISIKQDFLLNEQIKSNIVDVVSETGERLGQIATKEAIEKAFEQGLDLVMVSPNANPPVCKIMDYNKYKYEMTKKEKEAKKNQKNAEIKEIRLSAVIDDHDLEIKAKSANKFLEDGDKVKVSLKFRGREMKFIEKGRETILKFILMLTSGQMDKAPKLEGKFLNCLVLPKVIKK